MAVCAPRYDPRLLEAIAAVDVPSLPMAETARRVGSVAETLGLTRPSYAHLRRYVVRHRRREAAARERRDALQEIFVEAYLDATRGRVVNAYAIAARVAEATAARVPP